MERDKIDLDRHSSRESSVVTLDSWPTQGEGKCRGARAATDSPGAMASRRLTESGSEAEASGCGAEAGRGQGIPQW
jgi:hypothetical protein